MNARNSLFAPIFLLFFAVGILFAACRSKPAAEVCARPAVDDTLALRVACMPVLDGLPFYYAVESGLSDSLGLPLRLRTYQAQFDVDTAMMGTTVEVGLLDDLRLRYHQGKKLLREVECLIPLRADWRLVTQGQRRIGKLDKLSGRTIAVARHSASDAFLLHLRDSLRIGRDLLFMPQVNNFRIAVQMLDNDQLDGAVLPEPFAAWAQSSGHRILASTTAPMGWYVRGEALRQPRRAQQLHLLKEVYRQSVLRLNRMGHRDALRDSLLIHRLNFPKTLVDTLAPPRFSIPPTK